MLVLTACGRRDTPERAGGLSGAASNEVTRAETSSIVDSEVTHAAGGDIELYPASQLARIAGALANGSTTARTFCGHPTLQCVEARRTASGVPEVHDRWIDVTMVQAGRAIVLTGGRVTGDRLASPGEHRGGTIVGGVPHSIAAGDLVIVPAGIPHQYQVAPGDSVVYLTIKVARGVSGG